MNAETYAEFLRGQGEHVIRSTSGYWHGRSMGVYQAFPYHRLIDPSDAELAEMFSRQRALALRYWLPAESGRGCPSYAIVCEAANYDLAMLGHRTRKNVRLGLRNCTVEPISFQRVVDEGWELRQDTLNRQRRQLNIGQGPWRSGFLAAGELPGFQAWGAYVNRRLAAYLVTFQMDDCISVVDQKSHREFLDLNVNHAITFAMSQSALSQPGIRFVFYGAESLDAPPGVSDFKFRMGYVAKPLRQRIVFRPRVAALANQVSYTVLSAMTRWWPADRRFSKARGMLRVCLAEKGLTA